MVVGDLDTRWCRILDIFLLESFNCRYSWPSSVRTYLCYQWGQSMGWLSPLGEVILAPKLSAMACTRPISDDWIPVNCILFDAATAADALNCNCSSYEQQIPRSWNCCTRHFWPRVTIWSGIGWFVTTLVRIFPITMMAFWTRDRLTDFLTER